MWKNEYSIQYKDKEKSTFLNTFIYILYIYIYIYINKEVIKSDRHELFPIALTSFLKQSMPRVCLT